MMYGCTECSMYLVVSGRRGLVSGEELQYVRPERGMGGEWEITLVSIYYTYAREKRAKGKKCGVCIEKLLLIKETNTFWRAIFIHVWETNFRNSVVCMLLHLLLTILWTDSLEMTAYIQLYRPSNFKYLRFFPFPLLYFFFISITIRWYCFLMQRLCIHPPYLRIFYSFISIFPLSVLFFHFLSNFPTFSQLFFHIFCTLNFHRPAIYSWHFPKCTLVFKRKFPFPYFHKKNFLKYISLFA